jgi:hypothetical protein
MRRAAVLALLLLAADAGFAAPPTWQTVIDAPDRKRLAKLWQAWTRALADADRAGQAAALTALGPAVVPDAATMNRNASDPMTPPIGDPLPGPGAYRCRMINLGARADGVATPVPVMVGATPFAPCRIEMRDDGLWFEQDSGPVQRLGGRLYADGARMVFLGTTALAGEMGVMAYGVDPQRNAVGALRAIGDGRWRLELPWPNWQSNLGIVEIVSG